MRVLLHINWLLRRFLGSLHVLEVNVALLGFLDNLLDLQLREVHLGRRVLVLRL